MFAPPAPFGARRELLASCPPPPIRPDVEFNLLNFFFIFESFKILLIQKFLFWREEVVLICD